MSEKEIIAAIDIGTTKITVIVGCVNSQNKLEILGISTVPSEGVHEGIISNIQKVTLGIRNAIQSAEQQSGVDIKKVNVGIAGKHIRSRTEKTTIHRTNKEQFISESEIRQLFSHAKNLATSPGEEVILLTPQQYMVDNTITKDPIGMLGLNLEASFHVINARQDAIQSLKRCIEQSELEIDDLFLEPVASSLSVLSEEERLAGVALIDIGGDTTDIAIFQDGILAHIIILPIGGNLITNDFQKAFHILRSNADRLKVRFGDCDIQNIKANTYIKIPGIRNIDEKEVLLTDVGIVTNARVKEMAELIAAEIRLRIKDANLMGGVVLTGGTAQLKNIDQLFQKTLKMRTRIGTPNEQLENTTDERLSDPALASAVGLLLAGRSSESKLKNGETQTDTSDKKAGSSGFMNIFNTTTRMLKNLILDDIDDKIR